MAGHTMYINCRRQGFKLTEEEAQEYCDIWANTFPEMQKYFEVKQDGWADDVEDVDVDTEDEGEDTLIDCSAAPTQARRLYKNSNLLGMWRVRCSRNAALNFPFQSLAAVISKRALWLTYLDSLKYGYKLSCFIHDEIIVECKEEIANEVANNLQRLMLQAAHDIIPEIRMKAEPAMMRRWSKDAEPAFDKNGKLIPFEDVPKKAEE